MSNLARAVGAVVIALILVSIPGLLVASFVFEWHGALKVILIMATSIECVVATNLIYDWNEE